MMANLFLLGVAILPPLAFFGGVGALIEWCVHRKEHRKKAPLGRYPEPRFKERITGDALDGIFYEGDGSL